MTRETHRFLCLKTHSTFLWLGMIAGMVYGASIAACFGVKMNLTFSGLVPANTWDLAVIRCFITVVYAISGGLFSLAISMLFSCGRAAFQFRRTILSPNLIAGLVVGLCGWLSFARVFNVALFEAEFVNRVQFAGREIREGFLLFKVWAANAGLATCYLILSLVIARMLGFIEKSSSAENKLPFFFGALTICVSTSRAIYPLNAILPDFLSPASILGNVIFLIVQLVAGFGLFALSRRLINGNRRVQHFGAWVVLSTLGSFVLTFLWTDHEPVAKDYLVNQSPMLVRKLVHKVADFTDHDGDGYSAFSIVKDALEGNAGVSPFAIDIPDNGIDEDGVGGDITTDDLTMIHEALLPRNVPSQGTGVFRDLVNSGKLNVIVVKMDGFRADRLPGRGHVRQVSAALARFVGDGVDCTRARTPSTGTSGATYSLLMSMSPVSHRLSAWTEVQTRKIFGAKDKLWKDVTAPTPRDLAEILKRIDFHTVGISGGDYAYPSRKGFSEYIGPTEKPLGLDVGKKGRNYLKADEVRAVFEDKFDELIDEDRNQFFFVGFHEPHAPFDLDRGRELYGKRGGTATAYGTTRVDAEFMAASYDANVEFVSEQFAEMTDFLRERGEYSNSLIVLFSDHGEEFLEHRGVYHISTLYGELTNVVLVFKFPKEYGKGGEVGGLTSLIDIAPTILDSIGEEVPATFEGASIMPVLSGGELQWRSHVRMDLLYLRNNMRFAIESDRFKFIRNFSSGLEELYDLEKDPHETKNLVRTHQRVAERLRIRLFNWKTFDELRSRGLWPKRYDGQE